MKVTKKEWGWGTVWGYNRSNCDGHGRIFHRVGGPAVIYKNGARQWFRHGKTHRLDGPAQTHFDGEPDRWCIDGHTIAHGELSDKEYLEFINAAKKWKEENEKES